MFENVSNVKQNAFSTYKSTMLYVTNVWVDGACAHKAFANVLISSKFKSVQKCTYHSQIAGVLNKHTFRLGNLMIIKHKSVF